MRTSYVVDAMENVTPSIIKETYSQIADSYNQASQEMAYIGPQRCAVMAKRLIENVDSPIADFGAGTGLVGVELSLRGFKNIYGFDCTPEMLAHADQTGAYQQTFVSGLNDLHHYRHLRFENGIACGLFTPGHADPELLLNICDGLPLGGRLILTLNDWFTSNQDYASRFNAALAASSFDAEASVYDDHCSGIGLKSKVIVLKKKNRIYREQNRSNDLKYT